MERGSDKHSARVDEALEHEVHGMLQAGRETRGQQWNTAEPSGEDQPDVDLAPDSTLVGGVPDGMTGADVEERATIASYLGKEVWPAGSQALIAKAEEMSAPDSVLEQLRRLPQSAVFDNVQDVWQALQGGTEAHRF
ncbi:MAG TPA: DUF2795 domain-containing protein [Mycobacteriales bacterium]|nr:DUF2795 domain-containing protein [Mycobacteriales bacterium]